MLSRLFVSCLIAKEVAALAGQESSSSSVKKVSTLRAQRLTALGTAVGFAAVATDSFVTKTAMPSADETIRSALKGVAQYDNPTGEALSNGVGALALATAAASIATAQVDRRRVAAVGLGWLTLQPATLGLKSVFHRTRPDPLHHSQYSFPSGHTSNAAYLASAFSFILFPSLLSSNKAADMNFNLPVALLFTATATSTIACGRFLTDAHYFSDTLAGACLGFFFTSLVALLLTSSLKPHLEVPEEFLSSSSSSRRP